MVDLFNNTILQLAPSTWEVVAIDQAVLGLAQDRTICMERTIDLGVLVDCYLENDGLPSSPYVHDEGWKSG